MAPMRQAIASVLEPAVERGEVPGAVVAVCGREGLLYEGGFGRRALGGAQPMTPDTVAWIASMTKALTATAAMQLVEAGRLSLDAPAAGDAAGASRGQARVRRAALMPATLPGATPRDGARGRRPAGSAARRGSSRP